MARKKLTDKAVWTPPGFDLTKSYALQAVIEGRADAEGQKAAIRYIVDDLCGMCRPPEDLESDRATYYNLGRQVVGRGIAQIAKLNLGEIKNMEKKNV